VTVNKLGRMLKEAPRIFLQQMTEESYKNLWQPDFQLGIEPGNFQIKRSVLITAIHCFIFLSVFLTLTCLIYTFYLTFFLFSCGLNSTWQRDGRTHQTWWGVTDIL